MQSILITLLHVACDDVLLLQMGQTTEAFQVLQDKAYKDAARILKARYELYHNSVRM